MKINNEIFIKTKLRAVYLIGIFLILSLPLLAVPPLFHPPAWGKSIVFRIVFSALLFLFIYQNLYCNKDFIREKLKIKPIKLILTLLAALFCLFLLSTIFSPERYFSLWGNPYRAGGFLNFAFYIIFAIFTFLILKPQNWKKIWDYSIGIALLISIISLFQQSKFLGNLLVPYEIRMPGTLGSPIFLAIYLSFFIFLILSFFFLEKNRVKKIFYIVSFLIISSVIFLTITRAVFFGLAIAFLYYILFYPKKINFIKIGVLIFLALAIIGIYYVNTHEKEIFSNPLVIKNQTLNTLLLRMKINMVTEDPRFSFWRIAVNSLQENPILGYGPENFSIAYDKYYDPSLPYLDYSIISQVDRAHGFIFETVATAGIPALIIFLSLFGTIFWQLQRIKRKSENINIIHGVQATIIAYFIGVFFSFDTFDTHLIFFLLTGYCLYLIFPNNTYNDDKSQYDYQSKINETKWKKTIIIFLFIVFVLFSWQYNLKPLLINKDLNWAEYYSKNGNHDKAIDKMEKVSTSHSFIDNYSLLIYSNILKNYQEANPKKWEEIIPKSIQILEQAAKSRPTYTRTWILLGGYLNLYVENNENLNSEEKEKFLSRADSYFLKALQLNPKGQIIFLERANTYLLWGKYNEAKEISAECIKLNPNLGSCWAQKALTNIVLGELDQAKENLEKARQRIFDIKSKAFLLRLLKAHTLLIKSFKETKINYYQPLVDIYQRLIIIEPNNFQYHASLSYVFRTLGQYSKARKEALRVLELSPESKQSVEEFLKTLPY